LNFELICLALSFFTLELKQQTTNMVEGSRAENKAEKQRLKASKPLRMIAKLDKKIRETEDRSKQKELGDLKESILESLRKKNEKRKVKKRESRERRLEDLQSEEHIEAKKREKERRAKILKERFPPEDPSETKTHTLKASKRAKLKKPTVPSKTAEVELKEKADLATDRKSEGTENKKKKRQNERAHHAVAAVPPYSVPPTTSAVRNQNFALAPRRAHGKFKTKKTCPKTGQYNGDQNGGMENMGRVQPYIRRVPAAERTFLKRVQALLDKRRSEHENCGN